MSDAERAYAAAVEEIERVKAAGETVLSFDREDFHALDRIPDQIADLPWLTLLDLTNTQVADLTPIAPLTALQDLWLNSTPVADLTPLARLTALQVLWLNNTPVADLAPLARLIALQALWLSNTRVANLTPITRLTALQVLELNKTPVADLTPIASLTALQRLGLDNTKATDLRPISDLPELGSDLPTDWFTYFQPRIHGGLDFAGTPFAEATEETRRLAAIKDRHERTRETLAFLKTLPPPPDPLPWERQAEDKPAREPEPKPEPEPDFPFSIETILRDQSPLGFRFSPEHGAMVVYVDLRPVTEQQAQLSKLSAERAARLQAMLHGANHGVRGIIREECDRFAKILDDDGRALSQRGIELWASLIDLGAQLDANDSARAQGRDPLDLLRDEERAALRALMAIAGNLVRSFPDVREMDDSAGQFLRREVTLDMVAMLIETALRTAFVEARSAAVIQHVAGVARGEGAQADKATSVTARGGANLIKAAAKMITRYSAVVAGAVVLGGAAKVGADLADHYKVGQAAVAFIEDLRGRVTPFIDSLPADEAAELRAALEDAEAHIVDWRSGPQ